jgi:hypothetical protein
MSDHVITVHLTEAESPFLCKFDGKRFRKRPTAVKHLQQHHPQEIKQGRPYHSFLGGRRLAWGLLDTTKYLRVVPNNKRKSTPGAAVVTQKKAKVVLDVPDTKRKAASRPAEASQVDKKPRIVIESPLSSPKPLTPGRDWENVPIAPYMTQAPEPMDMSEPRNRWMNYEEPTYLPYHYSRDLLLSVVTLQYSCDSLNDQMEHLSKETHRGNKLKEREVEIFERLLDSIGETRDEMQELRVMFEDLRPVSSSD